MSEKLMSRYNIVKIWNIDLTFIGKMAKVYSTRLPITTLASEVYSKWARLDNLVCIKH